MDGRIIKTEIKVPKEVTLPDGVYTGTWGGNQIEVKYKDEYYLLTTDIGVRGVGLKVVVHKGPEGFWFNSIKN